MSRPCAETMPAVTVPPRPNGLPTAITQSPTRGCLSANFTNGKVSRRLDLEQREVGALVGADQLGLVLVVLVEADLDLAGAVDDVVVGHDVAVRRDDEAGALRLRRPRRALAAVAPLLRQVLEELVERMIVGQVREHIARRAGCALGAALRGLRDLGLAAAVGDIDADDRRLDAVDDVGKRKRRAAGHLDAGAVRLQLRVDGRLRKPEPDHTGQRQGGQGRSVCQTPRLAARRDYGWEVSDPCD